ncbi:hypothetical protein LMTR13_00530 [Bradyrhizobium icense]|uniref:Uncharacterized protein n=1 Tax=Bradyrhizobium icense TaxID=1274631 RepID=A0A1B1U834_9BRAD|nr:hypothetical protein LMTR13_00530 [Bradyrhizobium icense]
MIDSLAQAVARINLGEPYFVVLPEFHDRFVATTDVDVRAAMLAEAPLLTGDRRLDAMVGAIAHYLAGRYKLAGIPRWTSNPSRRLEKPWHTSSIGVDWRREYLSDGMREYLTFSSPAEFASRNIFTEERPLQRSLGTQSTTEH